jgi:hypothetical protein
VLRAQAWAGEMHKLAPLFTLRMDCDMRTTRQFAFGLHVYLKPSPQPAENRTAVQFLRHCLAAARPMAKLQPMMRCVASVLPRSRDVRSRLCVYVAQFGQVDSTRLDGPAACRCA